MLIHTTAGVQKLEERIRHSADRLQAWLDSFPTRGLMP